MTESIPDRPKLPAGPLHLLIVEDEPADAELYLVELRKGGLEVRGDVVSTAKEFLARLETGEYDIILADYALPGWSGLDALQTLRNLQENMPLLIVTGALGDKTVAELVRVGVTDYILKDRMARLPFAIRQALEEKKLRGQKRKIEGTSSDPVRLLYVEDNQTDAELSLRILKKAGFEIRADIVDTREEFTARLAANAYDVILSDQHLPTWTGIEAFEHSRALGFNIPVILVTGTLNDEMAAQIATRGLTDCVLKDRLARLPLVLGRVLEMKALKEQGKQHETNYRSLVERAPYGIFQATPDGKVLMANPALVEMLGCETRDAVLNLNLFTDLNQEPDAAWVEQYRRGEPIDGVEAGWKRRDGRPQTARLSSRPVRGKEGVLARSDLIAENITERKRTEEALVMLKKAVDTSGEVVFMTGREGVITFINPEFTRLYGHKEAEVVGKATPRILSSGTKSPEVFRDYWRALLEKRVVRWEIVNRTKDGRLVTVDASANPILDEGGEIRGFLAIQRDVTSHKQLGEQFRQAQKMEAVGRLAGGIAHDFNNLLTVINGYSDLLLGEPDLPPVHKSRVEEIKKAGDRAAALTRQLLAFSRQQVLQPEVLDLSAVISDLGKMLVRLIGEDIELAVLPAKDLWRVKADPSQIEQVLMNLAVNGRDAMPEGGKLTIETANVELDAMRADTHLMGRPGPYVMLAVSDTGCGMNAATLGHIFEPFFTTKEKGKGTGLGLATVYGIVKQSGGSIWVYSEPGRGTTFKIYLPAVEEETARARRSAQLGERAQERGGSETILLVEDEEAVRSFARAVLQSKGYRVLEAAGGEEGLRIAREARPPIQLLVTDLVMPGLGGRELARQLAAICPETKCLFMSGYTEEAAMRSAPLAEGSAFDQKPFTADAMARKVRELLDTA